MKHPILITECPKCGKMNAGRDPYLPVKLDADGKPDPNIGTLMTIECMDCAIARPIPAQLPFRPAPYDIIGPILRTFGLQVMGGV